MVFTDTSLLLPSACVRDRYSNLMTDYETNPGHLFLLGGAAIAVSRYPSSTLFPFSFWGLLVKAEHQDKGCP